ncbi:MAG: Sec-independent protein translocase subunit TatA/TatB [Nonlabens sp.]|uniref:Sec-independent protein translocase subunit TatA/TatB n=1 Tax=Nonlabens sp. TaxID=1888209 RepID=UPI003EF86A29
MLANFILGMPGYGSIILIALVVLLIFGGKKIPELMRGLGGGIKEFKDATKEGKEDKDQIDSTK